MSAPSYACLGGMWATDLVEVSHDPRSLDGQGRWAVVLPYEGLPTFLRFATWTAERPEFLADSAWSGVRSPWASSMSREDYCAAVESTREAIADGEVYQANICRVLEAVCPGDNAAALYELIRTENPAPYAGVISAPGLAVVTASPELFLARSDGELRSGPIKGTGRTEDDLLPKDSSENIMIVDLVRNDLSRIAEVGSVEVPRLLDVEDHPGLVHLVSEVCGTVGEDVSWARILEATFPPGSVTGAPKIAAVDLISELERASREIYCGAIGWVDADTCRGELAVAIRTFWFADGRIRFGTGAGITWASDAVAEWQETELKADHLIAIATRAEGTT